MSNSRFEKKCIVKAAEWPADAVPATILLRHDAAYLEGGPNGTAHIDCCGLLNELKGLSAFYTEPQAVLMLAMAGDATAAGCVAVTQVRSRPGICELKRLWTEPDFRGLGVGRALVEAAIAWARAQDANMLLLDTQPEAMPQAVALYRALGFTETSRYNDNPVAGLLFMELRLH